MLEHRRGKSSLTLPWPSSSELLLLGRLLNSKEEQRSTHKCQNQINVLSGWIFILLFKEAQKLRQYIFVNVALFFMILKMISFSFTYLSGRIWDKLLGIGREKAKLNIFNCTNF